MKYSLLTAFALVAMAQTPDTNIYYKLAPDAVPQDGVPNRAGYGNSNDRALACPAGIAIDCEVSRCRPPASLPEAREFSAALQARKAAHQTVRRLRPFRRRALITRRPFLVDIRSKKPCTRLRRRLCG